MQKLYSQSYILEKSTKDKTINYESKERTKWIEEKQHS